MFPNDFLWGAATSSYQIEGSPQADGKGASIWDTFAHQAGVVAGDHHGDTACDHYRRFREDVAHMKALGLKAYRFSISWPRILPEGTGRVNEAGLQFYSDLVDELLAAGITPVVTLFHWDFPEALMARGGWLNREVADWFAEYTRVVIDRLSDRVQWWITFNEPQCFAQCGHEIALQAPGMRLPKKYVFQVTHHLLLAHGKAVQVIREYAKTTPKIGFAPALNYILPDSDVPADVEAARQRMFTCCREDGVWCTPWWTEPIFTGTYPEDGLQAFSDWLPDVHEGDMACISQPLDFFGFNFYHAPTLNGYRVPGAAETSNGWPITPEGFRHMAKFLYERYRLPLLITENGMANLDWVALDGTVHDPQRIDFITRHLRSLHQAMQEGVPVLGYMYWSLMDNFEWNSGYNKRFGLIYVNYGTQERIWKDSAFWYQDMIAQNGANLLK